MKDQENSLLVEELKSLITGNKIELLENPKVSVSGDGLGFNPIKIEMLLSIIDMSDDDSINTYDILNRYNNSEYWELH